jgi:hypothetical protein
MDELGNYLGSNICLAEVAILRHMARWDCSNMLDEVDRLHVKRNGITY